MHWNSIHSFDDLEIIKRGSFTKPQAIFKHSIRCNISSVVKNRLDKSPDDLGVDFFYLDLISYREISDTIAETFQVHHESPQILLIKNGNCIYDESHLAITIDDLLEHVH
jgi:bacillithiol system protein YtxJ